MSLPQHLQADSVREVMRRLRKHAARWGQCYSRAFRASLNVD